MFILSIVAVGLLWLMSILHIYWAFGGRWGTEAVIPMKEGSQQAVFTPRKWGTLFVAMLLMLASGIILVQGGFMPSFQASIFSKVGSIVCALVFLLRAIGDFKYVGIFKTIKHSTFAQNDSKWYSPLCLFLSFVYVLVLV
ncbi:DUF3995 domain-containing protein [Lysinibacillus sp. JK80]|uniref:DUF3995 domain-containing protein n=1 Tax=Lysinibacillus sp. JK80 TaxID=2749809 RepID=UPI0022B946A3|nr:DUF3995 domain-containing protein [Lysinibacillus sp. JK80]WBF54835.1 DUF3995 domain-containing protein [Lysinibacillus sp. JK80]